MLAKWNVGWGTVAKCNMNCKFCYSRENRRNAIGVGFDDWKKFIDDNHSEINSINYGTGENTLDKNWFRLVKYIRRQYPHIRQALTTNGHLSKAVADDEACLESFVDGIDEIDVSLDFCDRARHNEFRGQPSAYDWALETFALCQKFGKRTTLVFLGSRANIFEKNIDGLFEIAARYDAILRMNIFRPTLGIDEHSKKFIIERETIVNILKYIAQKHRILSMSDALFSPILTGIARHDPSGHRSIRILSDGSITPSTYLLTPNYVIANIREEHVLERLTDDARLRGIMTNVLPQECEPCAYRNSCAGGVLDRRILWYGSLQRRDPYCPGAFAVMRTPIIKISGARFESVHEDYLPTIFFAP